MKELALHNCRLDGRFDIHALLGRGSYAEIYVARDARAAPNAPHNQVVIKALNVFLQDDLDSDLERTLVENFQNEAIALDRVRHPNIISRLGHGTAKDLRGTVFHYLVLEYLPGGDLAQACKSQSLPFSMALDYLEQVCAGLAHAHKCGVIHRDIKPQNLLLTQDRRTVKIADFGVARLTQSDSPITRVGTNIYAPPEHSPMFSDREDVLTITELTPAADIYSLAKSTYVLITSDSPRRFSNAPISDLPVSIHNKSWAGEFLRVLQKATQSNPQARQQSVNEFWQDLVRVKVLAAGEESEIETQVSKRPYLVPQPSVTKGFSPYAPLLPKFHTSRELKYSGGVLEENNPRHVIKLGSDKPTSLNLPHRQGENGTAKPHIVRVPVKRKSQALRRIATFLFLLALFAAALFATQNYLRNNRIFPQIQNPFKKSEGIAVSDVNLRESADADSQRIGLVPKTSRVQIVNSKDNWYEVVVIEFSRPKDNPTDAERGWVNRRYIDVQE